MATNRINTPTFGLRWLKVLTQRKELSDQPCANKRSSSFKEDTYITSNLKCSEKKALQELKERLSTTSLKSNSMWGTSLLSGDERGDVILLKFLRARDFRVSEAFTMLEKCLAWRKEFGAENREMYERIFGDDEKLKKFLKWRVQVLERGIKLLHFKPGGVNSIIQVTDLKDMPKRELRVASNQIISLFQDNYPELVARKDGVPKPAYEFIVKGGEKVNLEIDGIEAGATITWELVEGGWELDYAAEFVPNAEKSYTIAIQKAKWMAVVDNTNSRRRRVATYRYIVHQPTA
ncbi:hypothetical protein IFM89_005889 [Coptis chinensis]|uniref:CRAL/TRIO N-terminal domain-containing protein n=1 Tax=Coptis chinensis TaxID=261450 RepID=A0A835HLQ2_9MAGN|nr:hypothetical protein IFM89_005889 [Coptis chinensis]